MQSRGRSCGKALDEGLADREPQLGRGEHVELAARAQYQRRSLGALADARCTPGAAASPPGFGWKSGMVPILAQPSPCCTATTRSQDVHYATCSSDFCPRA